MPNSPEDEEIKVFVATGCPHCDKLKDIVSKGRFNQKSVNLIDLNTEEGFPYLSKFPITAVPMAMKGETVCDLTLSADGEGDVLLIDCGEEE